MAAAHMAGVAYAGRLGKVAFRDRAFIRTWPPCFRVVYRDLYPSKRFPARFIRCFLGYSAATAIEVERRTACPRIRKINGVERTKTIAVTRKR